MDVTERAIALLRCARARLSPYSWSQDFDIAVAVNGDLIDWDFTDTPGLRVCALGAVEVEAHLGGGLAAAWTLADDALEAAVPDHFKGCAAAYNDDPTTTLDDIHALFDRAIAALQTGQRAT